MTVRKEIVFSDADSDIYEYVNSMKGAFATNLKQILREHMLMQQYRVDYDRVRRIVEDVIDEKGIAMADGSDRLKQQEPEKSFFGIGKTYSE